MNSETIKKILGIKRDIPLTTEEISKKLKITYFPEISNNISKEVASFNDDLKKVFIKLGIQIIDYKDAVEEISLRKRLKWFFFVALNVVRAKVRSVLSKNDATKEADANFNFTVLNQIRKGKKIKKGIVVIALGAGKTGNLPIDHTISVKENCIVTIFDMPPQIDTESNFQSHFEIATNLFAYHMTNIAICVNEVSWIYYGFAGGNSVFSRSVDFEKNIKNILIPKIAVPINPPRIREFSIKENGFDASDGVHKPLVDDLVDGSRKFKDTGLFPDGKSVKDLQFRNEFYKWIGSLHLDNRTGMSYGFMARQMPIKLMPLVEAKEELIEDKNLIIRNGKTCVVFNHAGKNFLIEIPEIWILSQRSGSNKINFCPDKDLIKIGLVDGEMILQLPKGVKLNRNNFRPSFDTRVMLAHGLANAVIGSILNHFIPNVEFCKNIEEKGIAFIHWHGYLQKKAIPREYMIHGQHNPNVSCATDQAAIYAFQGKFKGFVDLLENMEIAKNYMGDVHIEPHHGTIVNFPSIREFIDFVRNNKDCASLGDAYLYQYEQ